MDPQLICVRCKGRNILQEASVMLPVNHFDGPLMTRDEILEKIQWGDLYYCEDCEDYDDVTDYIPQTQGENS